MKTKLSNQQASISLCFHQKQFKNKITLLVSTVCVCVCVCALVAQSYLTLFDSMNCSPPGSSVLVISRQEYWGRLSCPSPGQYHNLSIVELTERQ